MTRRRALALVAGVVLAVGLLALAGVGGSAAGQSFNNETVDDFEDGNLNEYTLRDTSGSNDVSIISSDSYAGSNALELVESGGSPEAESFAGDGLPAYPDAGDTIEFRVKFPATDGSTIFAWFMSGAIFSDSYYVDIEAAQGSLALKKRVSGTETTFATDTSVSYPAGEWLRVGIGTTSGGGQISVSIEDAAGTQLTSLTASDSSHTSGGIAFYHLDRSGSSSSVRYDEIKIVNQTSSGGPDFDVDITGTNAPVVEGGTLDVNYNVTNTGSSTGTQTVELPVLVTL